MTRRRLLTLAALIAAFVSVWMSVRLLNPDVPESSEGADVVEPILKSEPILPYPQAVRVNLLIHDLKPDHGAGGRSSNPNGVNLTAAQTGEFSLSVRKFTLLNDGSVGATACFEPHHFFRYYDAKGSKIGEISVCFCCGNSQFSPVVLQSSSKTWVDVDIDKAERFVKKIGLPTDMHCQKNDPT